MTILAYRMTRTHKLTSEILSGGWWGLCSRTVHRRTTPRLDRDFSVQGIKYQLSLSIRSKVFYIIKQCKTSEHRWCKIESAKHRLVDLLPKSEISSIPPRTGVKNKYGGQTRCKRTVVKLFIVKNLLKNCCDEASMVQHINCFSSIFNFGSATNFHIRWVIEDVLLTFPYDYWSFLMCQVDATKYWLFVIVF